MVLHSGLSAAVEVDVEDYGVVCDDSDDEDVNEEVDVLVNSARAEMPMEISRQLQHTFPPFSCNACRDVDEVLCIFGNAIALLT
jgi:hypothetical protein